MTLTIRPFSAARCTRTLVLLGALFSLLCGASAQAQRMDWDGLTQLAQSRATETYRANSDKLPAELASITYDQLRDIRFKTDQSLWRADALPFEAQFFHLGLYQTEPVRIHELMPDGRVNHLPYRGADFDYGKNTFDPTPWGDLGHAGFRLHYPLNGPAYKDELVVFQGASYFRALGRRPAIRPVGPRPGDRHRGRQRRGIPALHRVLAATPGRRRHRGHRAAPCSNRRAPPAPTAS